MGWASNKLHLIFDWCGSNAIRHQSTRPHMASFGLPLPIRVFPQRVKFFRGFSMLSYFIYICIVISGVSVVATHQASSLKSAFDSTTLLKVRSFNVIFLPLYIPAPISSILLNGKIGTVILHDLSIR